MRQQLVARQAHHERGRDHAKDEPWANVAGEGQPQEDHQEGCRGQVVPLVGVEASHG